jgi:peptidyl-prolyl cis-trans isomerase C
MDWWSRCCGVARAALIATFVAVWPCAAVAQAEANTGPSSLTSPDLKTPVANAKTPLSAAEDAQARSARTVVAEVEGRPITLGDIADAIAELPPTVRNMPFAELYPAIRGQLVRQQALVIRAQQQGLDEDPEVRRMIKAASDRVLSNTLLQREISRSITEASLLERYKKDIADRPGPEEVHVRAIMVPTEQEALAVIEELQGGADFAVVAKRVSKDLTASFGGDAGFVTRDGLTAEIGAVVFSMAPGLVTAFPVRSGESWFVFKVEERRHRPTRPFGEARADLLRSLMREAVPDVAKAALAKVTVREYDIGGKETGQSGTATDLPSARSPNNP